MKKLLILATILISMMASANQKWTRKEETYKVQPIIQKVEKPLPKPEPIKQLNTFIIEGLPILPEKPKISLDMTCRGENIDEIVDKIAHKAMTEKEKYYLKEEVKFLNENTIMDGESFKIEQEIQIPRYSPLHGSSCCADMRNILVAVMKGKKYGVHWAYLIGVRSEENPSPSRDHYAYGVVTQKGTDLWTQASAAAQILKRITRNANNPSFDAIASASYKYVGYESSEWVSRVSSVYSTLKRN